MRKDVDRILAERDIGSMLLYADRPLDVNLYYLTGFLSFGPTVYLKKVDEEPVMIVIPADVQRAERESLVKRVCSYFDFEGFEIVKSASDQRIGLIRFIAAVAKKELDMKKLIYVPPVLSVMVADVLRHEGLNITPLFDVIEEARQTKEPDEIEAIESVQRTAEKAMTKAIEFIADSEVGTKDALYYLEDGRKKVLTAGKIHSILNQILSDGNCIAEGGELQVASGIKSADPNCTGEAEDVLRANQPIVLDIFPRSTKRLYHTDMARTMVKGKASKQIKNMFEAAFQAKDAAVDAMKAGILGRDIEDRCFRILEKAGYETMRGGKQIARGLLHDVGHGVGLDSNERPAINGFQKCILEEHNVVTAELGLYDPDVGGVRLEDILEITRNGCRNLTELEVCLEV